MSTLVLFVVMVVVIGGMLWAMELYGRYEDRKLGIKSDADYVKYVARRQEEHADSEVGASGAPISDLFGASLEPLWGLFRASFRRLFPVCEPERVKNSQMREIQHPPDSRIVTLGRLDNLQAALESLPAGVLVDFEDRVTFHRYLGLTTALTMDKAAEWLKGDTARTQFNMRDEREKYVRRHGADPWAARGKERKAMQNDSVVDELQVRMH